MVLTVPRSLLILIAATAIFSPACFPQSQSDSDAPTRPQKIVSVEVVPFTLPVLVGNDASPLLKLKIETTGQLNPISLTELKAKLDGPAIGLEISSLQVCHGDTNGGFSSGRRGHETKVLAESPNTSGAGYVFSCPQNACELTAGTNIIWIAGRLSKDTNISCRCAS